MQNTPLFRSQQNNLQFFTNPSAKSDFVISLAECMKCHIQYLDKAETDLSLINNLIGNLITYQMIKRNRFCRTIQIGTHIICVYNILYT